jgi:hypothetical protein
VLGTGQIASGLGNAEVQRTPGRGGGIGGGAGAPGVVAMGGEQPVDYVPAVPAAWPERRADRTAAAKPGSPNSEHVLQFSRAIDRAQAHVDARRYAPAVSEFERAEQIVLNARTPALRYEAALRDLAAARLAAARGNGRAANAAIEALKSRLRAPA